MSDFKAYGKDWATKELPLRIDLIVSEYRQARDKKKQIDILAEQCWTQPCRIAWILDRCGLEVDPRKMPRARRNEESFDYVAHWESSIDAVICDRIMERLRGLAEEAEMPVVKKQQENQERVVEDMHMEADEREEIRESEKENSPVVEKNIPSAAGDSTLVEKNVPTVNEPPITSGEIMAEFWNVYLENRKTGGKLTEKDIAIMRELEEIAIRMVWDE